jgi:5-methylcytosine-specific restriction enzyme A
MLLLRFYFAFQLDDAQKDLGRRTALPGQPKVQIVGSHVEDKSDLRFAVVVDHITDGSYVQVSVSLHGKKAPASDVPSCPISQTRTKRLYDKRQWRRLREQVLRMEPLCRLCVQRGLAVPAVDVDHITPLADGGEAWAFTNLRPLCHSCHSLCTNAAKTGRQAGGDRS